jgi:hypothetical protein
MGTIKTTNIEPIADNGTVTLGSSGDTFTVPSGVTVNMSNATQTGVGGANTPAWRATMSTAQTNLSNNTAYLVHFDTEVFDTDGAYTNTTSNFKFTVPSGKAGKYFIGANVNLGDYQDNADYQMKICWIYVNGSSVARGHDQLASATFQGSANNLIGAYTVQDLSVGDYVQVYGQVYNVNFDIQTTHAEFYGYKLIGV